MKLEPWSKESEESVLGGLINNTIVASDTGLHVEDFYNASHSLIFSAISEISSSGGSVDIISVNDVLGEKIDAIGGSSFLANLSIKASPSRESLIHHSRTIQKYSELRKARRIASDIIEKVADQTSDPSSVVAEAISKLSSVGASNSEKTDMDSMVDRFSELQEEYAEAILSGKSLLGISTGFRALDSATDGLRPHNVVSIIAAPSVGKSAFMLNIVNNVLKKGKRVVIFSLEMPQHDILSRLMAIESGIHSTDILKGLALKDSDRYDDIKRIVITARSKDLSIYSQLQFIDDIISAMMIESKKKKVDLFVLDYLQNVSARGNKGETEKLSDAARALQRSMSKIDSTLLLLSQVSIETKKSSSVFSIDGKGTGAIREVSDVVVYLKNDGDDASILGLQNAGSDIPMKAIINKNRVTGKIFSFNIWREIRTGKIYEKAY